MNTVDNAIYDRIPESWWSDESFMALLRNAVNPPRFAYFSEVLARRFGDARASLSVLDVGCGVTGVDISQPTLAAAREHARSAGLSIRYETGDAADLPFAASAFDIVCCCDVLEHVDDLDRVIAQIARVMAPEGIFFFDTINRTWRSKLLAIKVAQDWTRMVP